MKPIDGAEALYQRWEGAVAFRLFAEGSAPTLTVPEQIAAQIGDRIIAGAIPPGERIIEQPLAAQFNVSRGPIRDAIRILEREGLVRRHMGADARRLYAVHDFRRRVFGHCR